MLIDTEKLSSDIKAAVSLMLKTDADSVDSFDAKLLAKIARQSDNTAYSIKSGRITGETRAFLVDGIRHNILAFVGKINGIDVLTANRVHFAVSVVVFKTISDASGTEIAP